MELAPNPAVSVSYE